MEDLEQLVKRVSEITGVRCRPASKAGMKTLRELDVPDRILEFYAMYEPEEKMEFGPSICPIGEIEELCSNGAAGEAAFDAGLIPFGDLITGDGLCFDPANLDERGWPTIVSVSHGTVWKESTEDEVLAGTRPYCANLPALLEIMIAKASRKREMK